MITLASAAAQASPRLLFALAIAQLSLSYCFVAFFSSYFGFGRRFPFFHLSEIAAVIVLIGLMAGSLMHAGFLRGRAGRRLFAASLGAGSALLSLLYLGDFATNRLWNGNINYELVRDYSLWALKPHSESLQVSPAVYAVALVIAIGMPTLFVALSDRLFAGLESLIFSNRPYYPFADRRRAPYVLGGLATVVGALGIVLLSLTRFMSGAGLLHRDPVVGFFRRQGAVGRFGWYLNFEDQRRSVTEERAAYRERKHTATRNVVVIIVDSLRADHMSLYGYARPTTPFLSKLETDGHLRKVRVATSMCAQSPCGILSTMSGKNVPTIEYDFKIFDLLHDIGYRSYFILGGHHSWEGLRQAYGDEQGIYFDGSYSKLGSWDDDRVIDEGLNLVPPNVADKAFALDPFRWTV